MTKRIGVLIGTLALLVLAGDELPVMRVVMTGTPMFAAPNLTDLKGVDELKTLFNRDAGKVRLILLVSPT